MFAALQLDLLQICVVVGFNYQCGVHPRNLT